MFREIPAVAERRVQRSVDKTFEKEQRKNVVSGFAERLTEMSGSMLEGSTRARNLDELLERAGLSVRSAELVTFGLGASVSSAALGGFLFGFPFGLVMVAAPALLLPLVIKFLISRRRKKFVTQLGDTLQMMAGSLTAGYGLGQTLDSVARESESPTSDEFSRVVLETRLGRSLEDALDAMSLRLQAPDFDWVVDAVKIQASVGGNLSDIITQVGETIRARNRVRRQVDALTAEGKISAVVLFSLPFGLTGFISMSNPAYVAPLFGTKAGWGMLAVAGLLMVAGGLWLKKLVNPEF
jgi:tight adherence protein B